MKYNFKKKITAILAATLAAVTFSTVPASALTWDGTTGGGSGGGSISAPGGKYTVSDTDATACGYRFSRIDYYGITRNDPIDILCSNYNTVSYSNITNAEKFDNKLNKLSLKNKMFSDITWNTSVNNTNVFKDTDKIDVALPTDTTQIESTVMTGSTLENICKALGMVKGASDLQNGDKILVEPLFTLTLKGVRHVLTVSEIGIYGRNEFGGSEPSSTSKDSGSYGFIANIANKIWPSSIYNTDTTFWGAAWNETTNLISFDNLLLYGFGVAFIYDDKNPPIETIDVDLYPTNVTFLDAWGNEATTLIEGQTYTPVFHFYNNGSVSVYARVAGWSYPLWKDIMYDYSGNTSTQIYIGAWSEYAITARESFTITPDLYYGESAKKLTDYQYWVNTILHKLTIWLDCTSSYDASGTYVYVIENNTGNNQATYTHNFSPKQPDISQWIIDKENAASSWITGAVNNRIIYSGEQTNSQVRFTNISSFKLQINEYFKALLGFNNSLIASYSKTDDPTWHNSGEVWDRETGTFRAKNTENETNKTLYLRASAGERSFASAMGINIDAGNDINKISLSAYIYIKGLTDNTEYEYVTTNNVISKSYVIETPFKPTVVQANSEYRRGITVNGF